MWLQQTGLQLVLMTEKRELQWSCQLQSFNLSDNISCIFFSQFPDAKLIGPLTCRRCYRGITISASLKLTLIHSTVVIAIRWRFIQLILSVNVARVCDGYHRMISLTFDIPSPSRASWTLMYLRTLLNDKSLDPIIQLQQYILCTWI